MDHNMKGNIISEIRRRIGSIHIDLTDEQILDAHDRSRRAGKTIQHTVDYLIHTLIGSMEIENE
jgi:hypothetical protein